MDHQPDDAQYVAFHAPKIYHIFPVSYFLAIQINVLYFIHLMLCIFYCAVQAWHLKCGQRSINNTIWKVIKYDLKKKITDYISIPRPSTMYLKICVTSPYTKPVYPTAGNQSKHNNSPVSSSKNDESDSASPEPENAWYYLEDRTEICEAKSMLY